jgi:hypothetical protein
MRKLTKANEPFKAAFLNLWSAMMGQVVRKQT